MRLLLSNVTFETLLSLNQKKYFYIRQCKVEKKEKKKRKKDCFDTGTKPRYYKDLVRKHYNDTESFSPLNLISFAWLLATNEDVHHLIRLVYCQNSGITATVYDEI